jgi:hypothetical protein
MSEWASYRPSDLLMFAPRTYWRLFELHNEAWWPAPWLLLLAGLAGIAGLLRWRQPALRAALAGLAAAWAFVGWAFLLQRYAPINSAAPVFAVGFGVEALGLALLATRPDLGVAVRRGRRAAGLLLCAFGLLGHPLLAVVAGRPWTQAEVFGLAPDPTVIVTLGLLLWAQAGARFTRLLLGALWAVALAWCAISAATLWTMGSSQAWVFPALVVLVAGAASALPRAADTE